MVIRKRLNLSGPAIAFVTTTVFQWKPILTQEGVTEVIVDELHKMISLFQVSIISYVIMPSHLHLLLGFKNIENLSTCIQTFKSISSRRIKALQLKELEENDFKSWQPRFDDLIVVSEEQFKVKIEYIHNNPVKAGLVQRAEDWPYSSAVDWLATRKGLVPIDREFRWTAGQ